MICIGSTREMYFTLSAAQVLIAFLGLMIGARGPKSEWENAPFFSSRLFSQKECPSVHVFFLRPFVSILPGRKITNVKLYARPMAPLDATESWALFLSVGARALTKGVRSPCCHRDFFPLTERGVRHAQYKPFISLWLSV